jgi:hypothetical protein
MMMTLSQLWEAAGRRLRERRYYRTNRDGLLSLYDRVLCRLPTHRLANGNCARWFDTTAGAAKRMLKVRGDGGTIRTGRVARS